CEVVINALLARVARRQAIAHEHLHSVPLRRAGMIFAQATSQSHQRLAKSRFLESEIETHKSKRRRLGAKNRCRAKWPDHFVIAHVNEPEIAFVFGAFARDGK